MTFRATVELNGKTATGIEVPAAELDRLDGGKRPAVVATVNGYAYRTSVGAMGGRSMLPISAEHRAAAGVAAGDQVEVSLELDNAPRTVGLDPDLAAALAAEPQAKAAYDALSRSRQRQLADPVAQAKGADTKARRVAKALEVLRGN